MYELKKTHVQAKDVKEKIQEFQTVLDTCNQRLKDEQERMQPLKEQV